MERYLLTQQGTGGTGTSIILTSVLNFPTTGTNFIQVGTEEISYTGVNSNKYFNRNN